MLEITTKDIGKLYTTDGKDVWELVEFIPEPQVTMQKYSTSLDGTQQPRGLEPRKQGGISEFKDFVRLVPEHKPPSAPKRKYTRKEKPVPQEG